MSPIASQLLLWGIVGGSLLLGGLMRVSGRCSDAEREVEAGLHSHTCTICGRVQRWLESFDQLSPCVACQVRELRRPLVIDLEVFADADAIAACLDGPAVLPKRPDEIASTMAETA